MVDMNIPLDPTKDHYATLGVAMESTTEEIKSAYKRLAIKYHPDKGGDEEKMKAVNEAYDVIGDKEKRKLYDRLRVEYGSGSWNFKYEPGDKIDLTLRDFVIKSQKKFQSMGIHIPSPVLDDFRVAVKWVYDMWNQLGNEYAKSKRRKYKFGGMSVRIDD